MHLEEQTDTLTSVPFCVVLFLISSLLTDTGPWIFSLQSSRLQDDHSTTQLRIEQYILMQFEQSELLFNSSSALASEY